MKLKLRIVGIVVLLAIGSLVAYSVMSQAQRNIERSKERDSLQLSDFTEKEYEIAEIWERKIERKDMPAANQSYLYLKMKGEPFNFNVGYGMSDYGEEHSNTDNLLKHLSVGDRVRILANTKDLNYASEDGLLRRATDFLSGSNNEVEIYRLEKDGNAIFEQSIHTPSFSNRGFADMAISKNLIIILLVCAIAYGILSRVAENIDKKKKKE